ncbi:dihydrofolate reductase [Paenibacillus marchantiophytorum]|uniref:Dihydrofolate reductase n=1 Tax=Paenibacillus marchantiophytorum TaxID=1619310 RepID=A0ABQ1ES27_9BACL|nr:dihydrofolate reductase [Paenibacillus marchantiophytorum]GFZ84886.1 dihydrofolate reductase [Paenibacillus marchantiophytorum]
MIISIIAAASMNGVIGMDELIPWQIPGEQIRFKELTLGKSVIMGRKTFESIGKPLPRRKTVIISRTVQITDTNCVTVKSLEQALELLKDEDEIFIAGGGEIYREALPLADKLYLTEVEKEIAGNIYFPAFDKESFQLTYKQPVNGTIPYTYYTYERK